VFRDGSPRRDSRQGVIEAWYDGSVSAGSPTERFGPYLVYEQLGVGGMAQVHRAVAANADVPRSVALKRMLSHIAASEDMVKSFVREARLASYLRHQNVAQTYDLGRVGDTYFIVMELITGRNLREVLRHCGATTGPMPVPVALNILNQICDALDYAHNLRDETGEPLGIIHRDVSPSNIIVSTGGVVKLIDFGIAKARGSGLQTMSGTLKGKFAYMAPEYIAGQLDARADLFAVGVIAHELLTNRPLFGGAGDDIETLGRVRDMPLVPPSRKNPSVPPEIDDVVMTALARDPERRWQHATALRTALTTLTHRLGLVASNAQVIQWLDWAFTQRPRPRTATPAAQARSARDTVLDPPSGSSVSITAPADLATPSIVIEAGTVDLSVDRSLDPRMSQVRTRVRPERPPSSQPPPSLAPRGTPTGDPAVSGAITIADPISGPVSLALSRVTASGVVPAPVRPRASTGIPVQAQAQPRGRVGVPALASQALPIPSGPRPFCPVPQPSAARAPQHASRPTPHPPAGGSSPVTTVLLVVVAAAVAATTVYFVLPLLT
jgi:serine/threonine protein kinase